MGLTLWGNPILEQICREVGEHEFGDELRALCERMIRVMHAAEGAGLAGNQVGDARRFFVYDCDGQRGEIVNPVITWRSRELQLDDHEGCLSVPGFRWPTPRAEAVTLEGRDAYGEAVTITAAGYLARCFQHEVDHLDGQLYLTRLGGRLGRDARRAALAAPWHGQPSRFFDVA